jgi:hypothetical protein
MKALALVLAALATVGISGNPSGPVPPLPTFSPTNPMYGGSSSSELFLLRPESNRRHASLEVWFFIPGKAIIHHLAYSLTQVGSNAHSILYIVHTLNDGRTCETLTASFIGEDALDLKNGSNWALRFGRINDEMIQNARKMLRLNAQLGAGHPPRPGFQGPARLPTCA